jgi:hypothetical protein
MTRNELLERVYIQLKKDLETGELFMIKELLSAVHDESLEGYLPEPGDENGVDQ